MRRTVRRTFFYSFLLIFLVTAPLIVLYATGYSFNFQRGALALTGGIFVKTNQTGITATVDGKLYSASGFLSRGIFISSLEPGSHTVEITKDGFRPWKKTVNVESQIIQEFRSVILVSLARTGALLTGTTTPSAAGTTLLLLPNPGGSRILNVTEERSTPVLRIADPAQATTTRPAIRLTNSEFRSAHWNQAGTAVLLHTRQKTQNLWQIVSAGSLGVDTIIDHRTVLRTSATSTAILTESSVKDVRWASDLEEFYIQSGDEVFLWNRREGRLTSIIREVRSFHAEASQIWFVNQGGFFARLDLETRTITTLDRPGFALNEEPQKFVTQAGIPRAVIDSLGGLYVIHPETNKLLPIVGGITTAKISPDGKLLGFTGQDGAFSVYYLEPEDRQPFHRALSMVHVLKADAAITDFIWYGDPVSHIVYRTDKGIFFAEIDERFSPAIERLFDPTARLAENPASRTSFYLSKGSLLQRFNIKEP